MKKIIFLFFLIFALPTFAATIDFVKHNNGRILNNFVLIEGEIKEGDFEKFSRFIASNKNINTVYLASKGGNIAESLKIGNLVRELYLSTSAPVQKNKTWLKLQSIDNNVCASSCFFIYIAGVQRDGFIVGMHRPYMPLEDYKKIDLGAAKAGHDALKGVIANYLNTMNVSSRYLDIMFGTPSDNMYWLEFEEVNRDFNGYVPAIQEWMKANCSRIAKDDELTQRAIFARIPSERQNMPMLQAVTDPADKEKLKQIFHRIQDQADCEANGLVGERRKALDKMSKHIR